MDGQKTIHGHNVSGSMAAWTTENVRNRRRVTPEELWALCVKDDPDVGEDTSLQTKAGFSYSMVIMDKTDGWKKEENQNGGCMIGARLAACL